VLTPNVGAKWLSADRADYSYGILDEEIARGVTWLLLGNLKYRALPGKVEDSPLLDSGQSLRLFLGVLRKF
jgi:outer membrane protein